MSKPADYIIQTKDLSIGYPSKSGDNVVQSNINLSINKGSLTAILGKNGAGKSTLLRTLLTIQDPLSGSIFLEEKSLEKFTQKELANKISVVLTEKLPESQLTVYELVALGRQPYTNWLGKLSKNDREKIDFALTQTDTKHLEHKNFYELSDGQLQRVLIARALAQDTEVIILDEPTAHLDLHHTVKVFQLLNKLVSENNKTIIMSSHEVNFAIKSANYLILMNENTVESGDARSLISKNSFDDLFPQEIIKFSTTLEQFIINNNF